MTDYRNAPAKTALRAQFEAYRSRLDAQTYANLSALIGEKVLAIPEVRAARTVHAYWPLDGKNEIDARPAINRLYEEGKRIVLPCVVAFSAGAVPRLEHREFHGEERLVCNRWGIFEPSETAIVAPDAIDVVIIPAFGADRHGHRIGHGRGFYDAFLPTLSAFRICLVYHECLVDSIPAEPHDAPVDLIVTEKAVVEPKADL